ncbi:MAG TPA: hypothetical protein VFO40_17505 [Chthoniobacterales bacterium]|nr:hypothetical protein [Chthoniobacterales bacterium]
MKESPEVDHETTSDLAEKFGVRHIDPISPYVRLYPPWLQNDESMRPTEFWRSISGQGIAIESRLKDSSDEALA